MSEHLLIFIKSFMAFVVLLVLTRIMGKKQLSQMTSFDYIVGITIGSIAATLSVDREINEIDGLIATVTWGVLPIITGYLGLKNVAFRRIADGESLIIIEKGLVNDKNMKKARYNMKDLLMQLRQKDVFDLAEVEFALLEPNGGLSVLKKAENLGVTKKDINVKSQNKGLVIDVIVNGKVMDEHLSMLGIDRTWLKDRLMEKGVKNVKEIIYAGITSRGELEIVFENNLEK